MKKPHGENWTLSLYVAPCLDIIKNSDNTRFPVLLPYLNRTNFGSPSFYIAYLNTLTRTPYPETLSRILPPHELTPYPKTLEFSRKVCTLSKDNGSTWVVPKSPIVKTLPHVLTLEPRKDIRHLTRVLFSTQLSGCHSLS